MKNKVIVTGVVGILIGFILGFFVSQIFVQNPSRGSGQQSTAETQPPFQLPAEHPPPEVMEMLGELQTRAEANPQDSQTRIALANAYYDMGRFDAAIQWYEQALQLKPDDVNVQTDLGTAYLYSGNPIKAVELYERSLEIEPDHAQTLYNSGITYLSTGNSAEALEHFEKLLESHPDHPNRKDIEQQIERIKATRSQGTSF